MEEKNNSKPNNESTNFFILNLKKKKIDFKNFEIN